MSKNRSGDKCLLERVESIMTGGVELPRNVLLDEVCQWNNNIWVVKDELAIEVSKTWEELNILDFLGFWLVLNNLDFVVRHGKTRREKNVFQILYWLEVEFTFFYFGIKTNLIEILKYFLNMPVIFGYVIWVDEYIIQIDHNTNV